MEKSLQTHDNLIQLKHSDIEKVREEILKKQNYKCCICNKEISSFEAVLDHQHKFKYEKNGEDGAGLIRGVLCNNCNQWEGKIWNTTKRFRNPKNVQERIQMLQQLIEYYQSGTYNLIHPKEREAEQKISKLQYNKLKKIIESKNKKIPEYPKTGKLTKKLKQLFETYNISPFR